MNSNELERTDGRAGADSAGPLDQAGPLSPRARRRASRQMELAQESALARAYRVEMEGRLVSHKVSALACVARSAMCDVALVQSVEDALARGAQGTALAGTTVDRLDLISRGYAVAAGEIVARAARRIADL